MASVWAVLAAVASSEAAASLLMRLINAMFSYNKFKQIADLTGTTPIYWLTTYNL